MQPASSGQSVGMLMLRGVIGSMFVAHGLQKLKGWFDGPGLKGTTIWFDSIGLQPGRRHAIAAGTTEAVGGTLMLAGLATPVSSAMITGTMTVAIVTVNGKRGMWATNHGVEYNLVLLASVFAIASTGPGRYSLDHRLGTAVSGSAVGIGQLALGLAGGAAVLRGAGAGPWQQTAEGTDG